MLYRPTAVASLLSCLVILQMRKFMIAIEMKLLPRGRLGQLLVSIQQVDHEIYDFNDLGTSERTCHSGWNTVSAQMLPSASSADVSDH